MHRHSLSCIVPPDLLESIIRDSSEHRGSALDTMVIDQSVRQLRAATAASLIGGPPSLAVTGGVAGQPHRTIYDQKESSAMSLGTVARAEGAGPVADPAVNEAYDGFSATYKFYYEVFGRNSIDGNGMPILGLVHFAHSYNNAFWDGQGHMFFGDGDGQMFTRLTNSLDVIGHELTHGVTQYTANLVYQNQSGALNESMSDVFGSMVKQYAKGHTAAQADWLIGNDIVGDMLKPALRSLKDPGKANKYDKQPADMAHFVNTTSDNGGVHVNSSIPSHAFYVAATALGGHSWEKAGKIWYESLRDSQTRPTSSFGSFAKVTVRQAGIIFGTGSAEVQAIQAGWDAVKVPH